MDGHERFEQLERALIAGHITRRAFIVGAVATGLVAAGAVQALAAELDGMRAVQARNTASLKRSYDYIVVGAGSAGCALVGTLAKKSSARILLIEAGDWDTAPSVEDPRLWFTNLGTDRAWNDLSVPRPAVNNRAIPEYTGRVVGGGSSINATIWTRPFKADLDTGPPSPAIPGGATGTGERCSRVSRTGRALRTAPSAAPAARSGCSPRPTPCRWRPPRWKGSVRSVCPWSTT